MHTTARVWLRGVRGVWVSCDWESDTGYTYEEAIRLATTHGHKCKTPKTKNAGGYNSLRGCDH